MASVGEILRRERERQGLPLAEIALQTRIKQQYLEALEKDDFDSLPGRFFARSFTTQYADKLGANTPELQAALQRQVAPVDVAPVGEAGKEVIRGSSWIYQEFSVDPLPEGTASAFNARKMTASVVMLVAVMVACGAIFWLWQRSQLSSTSASTESGDGKTVTAQQRPASDNVPLPAVQPSPSVQTPDPPKSESAPPESKLAQENPPQHAAAPVSAPAAPEAPQSGKINLAVVAKEDTWLRITVDGKVVVQAVLARGESRVAAASETAKILLGNAGGVDIRFNGADIGQVGPRGQVRTVDFTPEKFTVIEPQKRAPAEDANPKPVAELD